MKFKSTHRIIRAFLARFLCLSHIGLSIFVLYSVKKDFLYLLPLIGAILLIAETAVILTLFKGREPTRWFSSAFFIYVSTIVACYWFLELENIRRVLAGLMVRDYKLSVDQLMGDIVSNIKIIWSTVELQMFFALIMLIRWLIPKSELTPHGLAELLFKYFAISCDMLDFLSILQDSTLIKQPQLIYWTLGAWSWSTIQFFIFVPKFEDVEMNEFNAYITSSLLSVILLDLPYFGIRIAAIFAFGSHNYNSYFFATKNIVMILLQIFRIKATFSERKIREDKAARGLKDKIGFDKEANKLFDPYEMAKRNFMADRIRNNSQNSLDELESRQEGSVGSLDKLEGRQMDRPPVRMPRTIETVKYNKQMGLEQNNLSNDNRMNQRPNFSAMQVSNLRSNYENIEVVNQNEDNSQKEKLPFKKSLYTKNIVVFNAQSKLTDV